MNVNKTIPFVLLLMFSLSGVVAQQDANSVFEKLNSSRFIEIRIQNCIESYCKEEVNILYKQDDIVKIHSICLSTFAKEKQTDTVFILNSAQQKKLNEFDRFFITGQFPVKAAEETVTTFGFIINNQVRTLRNKSGYSFIEELLSK